MAERVLFWFRNDLRLEDNVALSFAFSKGSVLPVYILEEKEFQTTQLGFKKSGAFRVKFLLETLENLKENLKILGGDLLVLKGNAEELLFETAQKYQIDRIVCTKAVTQEETSSETELSALLKTRNIDFELIWQNTLIHALDLPFQIRFLPNIFTDFRKKVESALKIRPIQHLSKKLSFLELIEASDIPTLSSLNYDILAQDPRALKLKGGESAAIERMNAYIWESENIKNYKESRNGLSGLDYSSKFSLYLSLGCLSARNVYWNIKEYEKEKGSNASTYWLFFELLWRDYFCFIALRYGTRIFKRSGLKMDIQKKWRKDLVDFEKWKNGKTGQGFVDAFMRELAATGYMSNRGRQIVASYLCHNLKIEWWWGAMYFESMLIDYDVCSNWCNWNYIAGIGTDPRENRVFNPETQEEKYDPEKKHSVLWNQ
jgi:deoxyribodipyrimidine photo-lyase